MFRNTPQQLVADWNGVVRGEENGITTITQISMTLTKLLPSEQASLKAAKCRWHIRWKGLVDLFKVHRCFFFFLYNESNPGGVYSDLKSIQIVGPIWDD